VHSSFLSRALAFLLFSVSAFFKGMSIGDVDIVFGTSPPFFQLVAAACVATLKRKPFIFEVRDIWIDSLYPLGIVKHKFLLRPLKALEILLYKKADKVIANSPGIVSFINPYIDSDKIKVVPNGVATDDFLVKREDARKFRESANWVEKFIVAYIGNIGVTNDIDSIIDAADKIKELRNVQFVFFGGGIKADYYKTYCKEACIDNVFFFDPVKKMEIPVVLSAADICIATLKDSPVLSYPYPNKVFDYMAAGRPTVLAANGVICEVIKMADGGTVVPAGDSRRIADAVIYYVNHPEIADKHGRNARDYVRKHFERRNLAAELESELACLVSPSEGKRG